MRSSGRFDAITADAHLVIAGDDLRRFRYADMVERNGLSMTFRSQHRPIEAHFMALEQAGLLLETLREPGVPDQSVCFAGWQPLAKAAASPAPARAGHKPHAAGLDDPDRKLRSRLERAVCA